MHPPMKKPSSADIERRRTTFTRALNNMKTLAEGGTLAAPQPR